MNEYAVRTTGRGITLRWFADTAAQARRGAELAGHRVESVRLVREDVPDLAAGVECRCHDSSVRTCPAHGRRREGG